MSDVVFKLILLFLLLAWSGYFVYRLTTGVAIAWRIGRFATHAKGKSLPRVVRSFARPVEFWSAMALWHLMLVVFTGIFVLGIYGIWRVLVRG